MGGSREQETDGGIVSPCTHQPYHWDGKEDLGQGHDDGVGGDIDGDDDGDDGGHGYAGFEGKG